MTWFSFRDAVNDLALHFLAKSKIMCIKEVERDQVEFICKVSLDKCKNSVYNLKLLVWFCCCIIKGKSQYNRINEAL